MHTPSILLVEDNLAHSVLLKRAFKKLAVTPHIAHVEDGEAALAYLEACADAATDLMTPSLILLDLRLPKMDGLEVLANIKTSPQWKMLPVVMFSTSAAERDLKEAYAHHVNSYLVKPSGFDELSRLVQDLGTYWLGHNRFLGISLN